MKKEKRYEKIKRYCRYCGSVLGLYFNGRFNEYTGKREEILGCTNPKCSEHCGVFVEHIWGKFWKGENWEKCQRCGYVICDY